MAKAVVPPSAVRIIGKSWSVTYAESSDLPDEFGHCDRFRQAIKVDKDAHDEQQRDTLLHEVLHALDHELDTKLSERQIRLTATGLLCVLRENPRLLAYLIDGLKG